MPSAVAIDAPSSATAREGALRQFRKNNTNTARLFEAVGIVAVMQSVTEGGMKQPQRVVTFDQQRLWNRVLLRPVRAPAPADGRVGRLSERTARNRRFAAPLTRRRSVPVPWTIEPRLVPMAPARLQFRKAPYPVVLRAVRSSASA